ncbi:MAG: DUF4105 domain-containing protein [Chryseolinea sp.]
MRKCIALLFLLLPCFAQAQKLSEQATISVVTFGPYQGELYSAFGHSAYRVYDPANEIDDIYNYGVFDFDQPNFYLNFARGNSLYKLGISDYPRFRDYYIYYNRYVHEQVLNLTPAQTQKVFDYLLWNALPENMNYRYDYFYDNCATKIPAVILAALGDSVRFDGSYIKTDYSIRDLTDIYLTQQPWGDLGIDVCLGLPMDKKASPYEYMFLPDYVESGFDHASIKNEAGTVPLVKGKISIYEPRDEIVKGPPHPLYVFSAFAVIVIALSVWDVRRMKTSTWFDVILFGIVGLVGLLLFCLWFLTDHRAAARNMNLLWALPTHLIVVFAFIKNPKWLTNYFLVISILTVLLLGTWFFLPQKMNVSLMPLVVALLARAFAQFKVRKLKG